MPCQILGASVLGTSNLSSGAPTIINQRGPSYRHQLYIILKNFFAMTNNLIYSNHYASESLTSRFIL